jgi:hypothetical protein
MGIQKRNRTRIQRHDQRRISRRTLQQKHTRYQTINDVTQENRLMAKKKKNRKSRHTTNIEKNLDQYYWGYGTFYSHTVKSQDIHKAAQEIFGDTGYITTEALTHS